MLRGEVGARVRVIRACDQRRELCFVTKWGFNLHAKNMDLSHSPSPRSSCHSSKRCKKLIKRHKQRFATSREGAARTPHGPAVSLVIRSSAARGARPAQDPGATTPAHHTSTPPLRPVFERKAGTEAAHLRLQHGSAYFKAPPRPEPSAEGEGTQHAAAQSTGASPARHKTASRAAHNKRKQAFAYKCDAHRAYCCEACGTAVRDERLADFVLRNNSTAEQGVRGGGGWC